MSNATIIAQSVRIRQLQTKLTSASSALDRVWEAIWIIDHNLLPGLDEAPDDTAEQAKMMIEAVNKMGSTWEQRP
jgi:hypothetical protein